MQRMRRHRQSHRLHRGSGGDPRRPSITWRTKSKQQQRTPRCPRAGRRRPACSA